MEETFFDLVEFLKKPSIAETFVDILLCAVPIWLAVMIGLVIGWSWRPRWTGLVFLGFRSKFRLLWTAPPGFGARRLWLAFTALSAFSVCRTLWSNFYGKRKAPPVPPTPDSPVSSTLVHSAEGSGDVIANKEEGKEQDIITENDLDHLLQLLEGRHGEAEWQSMMQRSTPNFAYEAWRLEPENRPTVYRSRTVFEDATPEMVRDFFWDDEFRTKWDPMLTYFKILDECPHTGTMIVHWIKKGVQYPSLPRRDKPRRVDLCFSSWIIRAVESRKGDGLRSACEVILVHYEDMGIPNDVAKLGVRHGMWGTVKKIHSGFRAYQNARKSDISVSRSALMARITTKISFDRNMDSSEPESGEVRTQVMRRKLQNDAGIDWKWIVIGGTVAVVCGLRTGAIGKALLLGAGQRMARR
uniref:START domain-containing protein n=1 Tax=Cucumis sativus TaxID=3659 RepID=A0A0A0L598_CUCSA